MKCLIILSLFLRYSSTLSLDEFRSDIEKAGEPLFLTRFIENEEIVEAREKALVRHDQMMGIESYAGYLTVDKRYNSNTFFWYFPPQNESKSAPLLLWTNGGPGTTSMLGLFAENGPFIVTKDLSLKFREFAWSTNQQVLYIDNPIGAGYSYTENELGYPKSYEDVGRNVLSALVQFFQLFPELRENDFYVTGESYAGKWVPAISHAIKVHNKEAQVKINLKGLAIGNGITDPINQMDRSDFLYQVGLVDSDGREQMRKIEDKVRQLIGQKRYAEAQLEFDKVMFQMFSPEASLFKNLTGMDFYYNILQAEEPEEINRYVDWIQKPDARRAIHVGNSKFTVSSAAVKQSMMADLIKSLAFLLEDLLEDHKVLIYSGQLDPCVPFTTTENYVDKLNWPGAKGFLRAQKKEWRVAKQLAGYSKTFGNLKTVLVRNAGHFVPTDQPLWAWDMITRFVRDWPL